MRGAIHSFICIAQYIINQGKTQIRRSLQPLFIKSMSRVPRKLRCWLPTALSLSLVIVIAVYQTTTSFQRTSGHRQLRFLDPDHRTCGHAQITHLFALHQLYGAKQTEEGYYMRRTISTADPIPEDKGQINQIFRVLSYVARKTQRPIRVHKSIIAGYNSEHRQSYSLVHVENLKSIGVDVVEDGYWVRAKVAQEIHKFENHTVSLESDPLQVLSNLKDDDDKLELVFNIDELLAIDLDELGKLTGESGGYTDGAWTIPFSCMMKHPKPNAIPPANDPLSK